MPRQDLKNILRNKIFDKNQKFIIKTIAFSETKKEKTLCGFKKHELLFCILIYIF